MMHIFLFGDQTADQSSFLQKVFACKDHVLLVSFLDRVNVALREEVAQLPRITRQRIPDFSTVQELALRHQERGEASPAVESTILCIAQLAHFIGYFEERPAEAFSASNTRILGLCTGLLAAAAVASARSLTDLIPLAVEAVRIAFRTGIQVSTTSEALGRTNRIRESWSYIVTNITEVAAQNAIDEFHRQNSVSLSNQVYVSAVSTQAITVSGPPATLRRLFKDAQPFQKLTHIDIPVFGPYHAQHLYGNSDVQRILGNGTFEALRSAKPRASIHSAVTGKCLGAENTLVLIEHLLDEILRQPVRWDQMLKQCVSDVTSSAHSQCRVLALGVANVTNSLVTALKAGKAPSVTVEDSQSWRSVNPSSAPSGRNTSSKIAIVGMAGRFPGAKDHELLWELLCQGLDVHREVPSDRFDAQAHCDPSGNGRNKSHTPYGCFIEEPGLFDPRFFSMSPREAAQTDPMQRLALVTAYEALEMSGYQPNRTPSTRAHRIGTFYGQTSDDWREINAAQNIDTYFITGGVRAFAPGRINYFFKFSGPSFSIDTACSSSLAAIQLACTSLWAGDCDTAVTGGLNVLTNPDIFSGLSKGQFLSKTGSCKTYDNDADGYCRGDGVASIILKRMEDAIADNDNILGCILGAATNHSAEAVSITHPHSGAQEFLYKKVLDEAGVDAHDVSYVEMHGTGTQAGDGIEMTSVSNVFAPRHRQRRPDQPLYLGAIKANIGHGEAASGVNSLVKVMMMLKKNVIPPNVGVKNIINQGFPKDLADRNVNIPFKMTPFHPKPGQIRRVFLNNFSAAGGNTALLIEDGPVKQLSGVDPRSTHVVGVSAKSLASLKKNLKNMIMFIDQNPNVSLASLAYTTTARRIQHNYRVAITASDVQKVKDSLMVALNGPLSPIPAAAIKVAFAFTGQGSHYAALGKTLYNDSIQFRADIEQFVQVAQIHGLPSFLPLIDGSVTDLSTLSPVIVQVGQVCVQIALARLFSSWGIVPSAVLGHSLGEYAALVVAGVLSASDAIFLVGHRARLLTTNCTPGTHGMLAVRASAASIREILGEGNFEIACMNGPEDTVLGGLTSDIATASDTLTARGIKSTKLNVPFAFHTSQVDPILDQYDAISASVTFNAPTVPVISPLLGEIVSEGNAIGPEYLRRHARETVNFVAGLRAAEAEKLVDAKTVWVELGPHPVCSAMVKATLPATATTVPSFRRNEDAWKTIATTLNALHSSGLSINWNEYHREYISALNLLMLPAYSFDDKNYWLNYTNNWTLTKGDAPVAPQQLAIEEAPKLRTTTVQRIVSQEFKGQKGTVTIESDLSEPKLNAAVSGHVVNGACLIASSIYADMALTITDYLYKQIRPTDKNVVMNVRNMEVSKPYIAKSTPGGAPQLLQVSATADLEKSNTADLVFTSFAPNGSTVEHAKCVVEYGDSEAWLAEWDRSAFLVQTRVDMLKDRMQRGDAHKILRGMAYKLFAALVDYDQKFRGMEEVILDSSQLEATAKVSFQTTEQDGSFYCSPYWIDSVAHVSGFIVNASDGIDSKKQVYISHGWESMRFARPLSADKTYRSYVKMRVGANKIAAGDVYVFEGTEIIGVVGGLKFQCIPRTLLNTFLPPVGALKQQAVAPPPTRTRSPTPVKVAPSKRQSTIASRQLTVRKKQPSSSLVERGINIVATEVDVELAELDDERQFTDLGVDSLLALTISAKFREVLDLEIHSTLFTDHPTVGDLKRFLAGLDSSSSDVSTADSSDSDDLPDTPGLDHGTETPSTQPSSLSSGMESPELQSEETSSIVRTVIASEMGVDIEELAGSTNLASMGMDSLMSLAILGALRERMGLSLPSSFLTDHSCLEDIERALNPQSKPTPLAAVGEKLKKAILPPANSVLLQGNARTATKKLFLLPDGSGSATSYVHIPLIRSDTAVYGLNCPFMKTPKDYTCGIEGVSELYLAEIQRRQPKGPYYLGGWSAGGVVAYECTRQLMAAGHKVERLLLLDAPCPVNLEPLPSRLHQFFDKIGLLGNGSPKGTPEWLLPHFDSSIKALTAYNPEPMDFKKAPKTYAIWCRDGVCKNPGDPRPPPSADDPASMKWLLENRTDFGCNGWDQLLGADNMVNSNMGGNHFTMMKDPLAPELCRHIQAGME
ncbi:Type I Iterative PKS [Glutinoglossum americanum]|uniref:Type I Iterative PKS n=1 Tax=Glutinoglossum americanum TaxID=1670608 RepID=A0A9P8HZP1_9PEZI|nr:Type I Iterative PKS [Glutinoglossum americanum]